MPPFIACPDCACHASPDETRCPHCGATLRQSDGRPLRTAAALILGLGAAVAACDPGDAYGAPGGYSEGGSGQGAAAQGGAGGAATGGAASGGAATGGAAAGGAATGGAGGAGGN